MLSTILDHEANLLNVNMNEDLTSSVSSKLQPLNSYVSPFFLERYIQAFFSHFTINYLFFKITCNKNRYKYIRHY